MRYLLASVLILCASPVFAQQPIGTFQEVNGIRYCADGNGWLIRVDAAMDAMELVNSLRAQRGLRPLVKCPGLTLAAMSAARARAAGRIHGHLASDFAYVPSGYSADTAGCAAWPDSFGACAMYESGWSRAGAAFVVGSDGLRYCHVFYRR